MQQEQDGQQTSSESRVTTKNKKLVSSSDLFSRSLLDESSSLDQLGKEDEEWCFF